MLGQNAVEALLEVEHEADGAFHVGGGALGAAGNLVDHHMGVRQAEALAGRARRQKDGPHGGGDAQAVRVHVTGDELHRVVNRQARGDGAAGGVDVHVDVFFRVGHLEEQKLGNHGVRHIVVNGGTDEDDAVLQEAGVNVKGSFAAAVLLHHHGDVVGVHGA